MQAPYHKTVSICLANGYFSRRVVCSEYLAGCEGFSGRVVHRYVVSMIIMSHRYYILTKSSRLWSFNCRVGSPECHALKFYYRNPTLACADPFESSQ